MQRRELLWKAMAAPAAWSALTSASRAQAGEERRFTPTPGRWRGFELTTRVEVLDPQGATRVWLPVPSIDTDYQRSWDSRWQGNAKQAKLAVDPAYGARMLYAEFDAAERQPVIELTSRVVTQDRAVDWRRRAGSFSLEPAAVKAWTDPTDLIPTDGIVVYTAKDITKGAVTDQEKVAAIYDWTVTNTHREPTVRGCGVGDVKAMLETGNFGGKCADINGLFVGLCRAAGVPARDLYGIRLVPSAFGYRELSGNPAKLQGAQHCRAEVFLRAHGWVAMDPADVAKVMRQETPRWIKDPTDPLVAPVKAALFGGWEGNWLAFNAAHDVELPGARTEGKLGFLMYPQAENDKGRLDALDPDHFKYTITAKEVAA